MAGRIHKMIPEYMDKMGRYLTTTKHYEVRTVCIIIGIYSNKEGTRHDDMRTLAPEAGI